MDTCGIPNKANYHVGAAIGRDIPGGTETDWVDIYLCEEHTPAALGDWADKGTEELQGHPWDWDEVSEPVRSLFKFDKAQEWYVLEFRVSHLR